MAELRQNDEMPHHSFKVDLVVTPVRINGLPGDGYVTSGDASASGRGNHIIVTHHVC